MKPNHSMALASMGLLAMSIGCTKKSVTPDSTIGRVVMVESTTDIAGNNVRPRWTINISPVSLAGWNGQSYQQVKTFSLPDTLAYKVGATLSFHY